MKILAIESSGTVAGTAIWQDGELRAEYTVNYKKTHSQTLLPMIDEIIRMTETDKTSFDAIAVSAGPGSFTGLRIGSATAKGLGLAWKIPLAAVPTLDAMAYQCYLAQGLICPIMDARRKQVYTGIYRFTDKGEFQVIKPSCAIAIETLLSELNDMREPVLFLGDGVAVYRNVIEEMCTVPVVFAPAFQARQRAAAVAELGAVYAREGRLQAPEDHAPEYLRMSQAERERAAKLGRTEAELAGDAHVG